MEGFDLGREEKSPGGCYRWTESKAGPKASVEGEETSLHVCISNNYHFVHLEETFNSPYNKKPLTGLLEKTSQIREEVGKMVWSWSAQPGFDPQHPRKNTRCSGVCNLRAGKADRRVPGLAHSQSNQTPELQLQRDIPSQKSKMEKNRKTTLDTDLWPPKHDT